MEILLVAATEEEIKPFLTKHAQIHTLITGVGTVATTYQLARRLNQTTYDLVIQAGVAGAFDRKLALGSVFKVMSDAFGLSGIWENKKYFTLEQKMLRLQGFPYNDGRLLNTNNLMKQMNLPNADAITVDLISDDNDFNTISFSTYRPQIESMEGAAFHFVCLMEQVPFIQLRAVSNYVGERDKQKWELEKAIVNLNGALEQLFTQIQS